MAIDVLIIDDEPELVDTMQEYLTAFDISVQTAGTAEQGLTLLDASAPRVILLDVNLPGMNGFEFTRTVRSRSDVPILFLSARRADDDQILALGVGGDDYITKPFSLAVLLAKVRRVLTRAEAPEAAEDFDDGVLRVDSATGRTWRDGRELVLPALEDRLLRHLVSRRGSVVTKQELFEEVWGDAFASDGTLTVHIRRLRRRIEPDPDQPHYIRTVWGRGYLFDPAAVPGNRP